MKLRTKEEILADIQVCEVEITELIKLGQIHKGRGHWSWGNPDVIPEINNARRRLHNLKLEFNRTKLRMWRKF